MSIFIGTYNTINLHLSFIGKIPAYDTIWFIGDEFAVKTRTILPSYTRQ